MVSSPNLPTVNGSHLPTSLYVSVITGSSGVKKLNAPISMVALNADLTSILSSPMLRHEFFPVVTPLCWQKWETALIEAGALNEFSDVPVGIRDGFGLGYSEPLTSSYIPPNHSSATNNSDVVRAYITKEIAAGHYSSGFETAKLNSHFHFHTSPLGVVEQENKFRVISDFSFPQNNANIHSINSKIDYSSFKTDYTTFSQCYLYVANAPPGAQAAVYNVDAAYRHMPIAPEDQIYVCLHFDGLIHLDHNACFSSKSSHTMLG
jgi:hypothetical protein